MNCLVLEYADEIIVIDCGVLFGDLDHFGIDFIVPDFTYLLERKDKIRAFVITHGHEDHIGALPLAHRCGVQAPIYASSFTSKMIYERFRKYRLEDKVQINTFKTGEEISFKNFSFKAQSVNHSIIEAHAFFIRTPVGMVVHTGDFKIDPTPFYGSQIQLDQFAKMGDEGTLLLLSDSTNVERSGASCSDSIVYEKFEHFFKNSAGLTVISMFSSNIGRIGQVFELAKKMKKRVMVTGRSIDQNIDLAMEAGYLEAAAETIIQIEDMDSYPRKDLVLLSTGSQGEFRSALNRIANGEHGLIQLQEGDQVILSSKPIPGNEVDVSRVINKLFQQGANVLYEAIEEVHVSGHATKPELQQMIQKVRPRFFIPVHGEYRHLHHHAELARECGVAQKDALVVVNGDVVEVTPKHCKIVEHLDLRGTLIEGPSANELDREALKNRRKLAESGAVFSVLLKDQRKKKIRVEPEILLKGIAKANVEAWLVDEAKRRIDDVIAEEFGGSGDAISNEELAETVRIHLRRFFNENLNKKPFVIPIVLDRK